MPTDPTVPPILLLEAARAARRPRPIQRPATGSAEVIDLASARRRRMTGPGQIPEEVWEAMHRAGELADDLAERGERVSFDTHHLTGRVVAHLMSADDAVLRRLGLRELVGAGAGPDLEPAA